MSSSPQDGGHGSSTPDQPPRKDGKRPGAANQDGTDFEIKMLALVFLRAVQTYSSFTMRSNYEHAGDFDDIVFTYESRGNKQNILVQLKATRKSTLNLSPSGKLSLKSYFQSLKKSNLQNCSYVIFTNANVKLKGSVANDNSPAKKLLCTTWNHEDVCCVHLTDDICEDFRNETGAEEFVNRLLIFRNQCDPKYLDEFIKQELIKICNGFLPECQNIQQTFVEKMKAWWGKPTKAALDENWKEWTELKTQLLGQSTLMKEITFCEDTLSNLERRVLGSKFDIILIKFDSAETQMACSKVYQTFIRKECLRVLFTDISQPHHSQDMLFSLWSKDVCDVLVITDVTNSSENLGENIVKYKGNLEQHNMKKIVIVSNRDAKTLGLSQCAVDETDAEFIKSTFTQLDGYSKERLQNLPVDFQGKIYTLGSIKADKILEGGLLQHVLTSPTVQIGSALPACDEKYIPRTLSKRLVVNKRILNSNDMFFICGIGENDLLKLLIAEAKREKKLDERWFSEQKNRFYIKSPAALFKITSGWKCCKRKIIEDPVHFLEVIDDSLYWIHSHGSTDNLLKDIEKRPREEDDCRKLIRDVGTWQAKEEDLVTKEFQTVIVADEPGSGKTALLREVANKMKELYPPRWVINIDLNKHSEILRKMKHVREVTPENVLLLLSKAADLDDSELGKQLLKNYILESGDMCILFDAFDEVAPSYTDTVLDILKLILRDFRIISLWVVSRYNVKDKLEHLLETKVFRIEPLSDQEQFDFFSKLWGEEKAKKFRNIVRNKIPSRDGVRLSSFPLHLGMICEVCHDLVMSDSFSKTSILLNISNLYEKFIEMKLRIYFKEKALLNSPSAQMEILEEREREHFMKRHMICSLVVLDILDELNDVHRRSITRKVRTICQDIAEGRENVGIIDGLVEGKPHFVHRTFAEYFAGKWLAKHWEENVQIIQKIIFDPQSEIVYKAFCQELASQLPAHLAVLKGDIEALKGRKEDLNKTDILGRTPLHLAAQSRDKVARKVVWELLKYTPDLQKADDLLNLTPLYYAAKAKAWSLVRILVERGSPVKKNVAHLEGVEELVKGMTTARCDYSKYLETGFEASWAIFNERSIFHLAVKDGELKLIEELLRDIDDKEMKDFYGDTPMCIAVTRGDVKVVQLLIDNGALCDMVNKVGESALQVAQKFNNTEICDLLLRFDKSTAGNINNGRD